MRAFAWLPFASSPLSPPGKTMLFIWPSLPHRLFRFAYESIFDNMHPAVRAAVKSQVNGPYSHQGLTFEAALRGLNVVLTTPTASGKSLSFNIPVRNWHCLSFDSRLSPSRSSILS